MKDYAKCALADMILKYIKETESQESDLDDEEDDIFAEKKPAKSKIMVKKVSKKAK